MKKEDRFEKILSYFQKNVPVAETELQYKNPFQLLVAVILSAQCTDKRVNLVTPKLFAHFPDAETMAVSSPEVIFKLIRSINFPNNKSKHLVGMAKMLVEDYASIIPSNVDQLIKLPGVGRKTANVILSVVYNKPAMAVDTHVFRVSARLGLTTNSKNPTQTEIQLIKYIPKNLIAIAHHWLILHGRYTCIARKPKCEICPLTESCLYYNKKNFIEKKSKSTLKK